MVKRFITRRVLQTNADLAVKRLQPLPLGFKPSIANLVADKTETVQQILWRCSVCHHEAWVDEGSTLQCCKEKNQRG